MKDSRPLVSIGMPVFNGERYLCESLDSLLGQTYENLEVVISDNASTDSTEAICREYMAKDARVRYHRNPANIGLTRNFRRVLGLSRGEYFTWASVDDVRPATIVEQFVDVFARNNEAVMVHGHVLLRMRDRSESIEFRNDADLTSPRVAERVRNFTDKIEHNSMVYGLYRREAIAGVRFDDHFGQEYVFCLQVCLRGPIEHIPAPMITYRARRSSVNHSRMYLEAPITLRNLLTAGSIHRIKCWVVLLTGCWDLLRLPRTSWSDKGSAIAAFSSRFIAGYGRLLCRELLFSLFYPPAWLSWQIVRVIGPKNTPPPQVPRDLEAGS
jgi:glycosyltransferase involved in cell wall biosynthesis